MPAEKVIVFCKAPRPGFVKTRVAARLGPDVACSAYRELVESVLSRIAQIEWVQLRHTPDDSRGEIARWKRRPTWELQPQGAGDLGARLVRAFREEFEAGTDRVVIIGTDSPEVLEADIREALHALRRKDLVVGPALDGGYWLIGLSEAHPSLFAGIDWSTPAVLEQTLYRAKAERMDVHLLRVLADIDTAEDFAAYQERKGKR